MLFKNTRKYQRAESKTQVYVTSESGSFEGTMLNVSLSGLFAVCDVLPPVGDNVQIEIQFPESAHRLTLEGRIVRTVKEDPPPRGIGVEFTDLPEEAGKIISAYVARCQISQR